MLKKVIAILLSVCIAVNIATTVSWADVLESDATDAATANDTVEKVSEPEDDEPSPDEWRQDEAINEEDIFSFGAEDDAGISAVSENLELPAFTGELIHPDFPLLEGKTIIEDGLWNKRKVLKPGDLTTDEMYYRLYSDGTVQIYGVAYASQHYYWLGGATENPWEKYVDEFGLFDIVISGYLSNYYGVIRTVPYQFRSIGGFPGNQYIRSVTIPATNTPNSQGSAAAISVFGFDGCTNLEEIIFQDWDGSKLEVGGLSGTAIKNIEFPEGTTEIRAGTFEGCDLDTVVFPSTLRGMDFNGARQGLFKNGHVKNVIFKDGITTIPYDSLKLNCFYMAYVENVYIPASVTDTGSGWDKVLNPESINIIGEYGTAAEQLARDNYFLFNGEFLGGDIIVDVTNLSPEEYEIYWYEVGGDEVIGVGNTYHIDYLYNDLEYEIVFNDEETYFNYVTPERQTAKITERKFSYKYTAEERPKAQISISMDFPNLPYGSTVEYTVTAIQTYGNGYSRTTERTGSYTPRWGYYPTAHITLGPDEFRVVPTTLIIDVEGYLRYTVTLNPEDAEPFGSNKKIWNLGTIPLKSYERAIKLGIYDQELTVREDISGSAKILPNWNGLSISVRNETTGNSVSFTADYPNLIINSGVNVGDIVTVTAKRTDGEGYNAKTETATASGVIGDNGSADIDIFFPSEGRIYIPSVLGVEEATVMVMENGGYGGGRVTFENVKYSYLSAPLVDGDYTVLVIKRNSIIESISKGWQITQYNIDSSDYILIENIKVEHGKIADLGDMIVPDFDENKYTYFDQDKTSVTPSRTTTTVGNPVNLRIEYALSPYHTNVTNRRIVIESNMELIKGSVTLNGKPVNARVSDSKIYIDVEDDEGIIRLQIASTSANNYGISVYLSCNEGISQIGSAIVKTENFTINVPEKTGKKDVRVWGRALPDSDMAIYDNNVLVGTAHTNNIGIWSLSYELDQERNYGLHDVYAKIVSNDWRNGTCTDTATIEYYSKYIDVSRVIFTVTDHVSDSSRVVFDYNNTDKFIVYEYNPSYRLHSFIVEFTHDASKVKNVRINVFEENGDVITVDARYDAKNDYWVAAAEAGAIVNVGVEYDCDIEFEESDFADPDMTEIKESITACIEELSAMTSVGDISVYDDGVVEIKLDMDRETIGAMYIEEIDYYQFDLSQMEANNFIEVDGSWQKLTVNMDSFVQTCVFPEEEAAYTVTLPFDFIETEASNGIMTLSDFWDNHGDPEDVRGFLRVGFDFLESNPFPLGEISGKIAGWGDYNNLQKQYRRYTDMFFDSWSRAADLIDVKCYVDHDYRLELPDRIQFNNEWLELYKEEQEACEAFELALEIWTKRFKNSIGIGLLEDYMKEVGQILGRPDIIAEAAKEGEFGASLAKKLPKLSKGITTVLNWLQKYNIYLWVKDDIPDIINGVDIPTEVGDYLDFNDIYLGPYYRWLESKYLGSNGLIERASDLNNRIIAAWRPCPPDKPKEPEELKLEDPVKSPCLDAVPLKDPSGFVYEAVASNRLEGVKVTAYQAPSGSTNGEVWGAEAYGQENPLYTDYEGRYAWIVPNGNWQVKAELDGYETAYSEWVPVPPVQTEVNIGMVAIAAPYVKSATAFTDGIRIEFTQYMKPETVNGNTITVTVNGKKVTGKITAVNAEEAYADPSIEYASVYTFIPDVSVSTSDTVTVAASGAVSYNGKSVSGYNSGALKVRVRPQAISVAASKTVVYGEGDEITVKITPDDATGYTLTVKSSSPSIAKTTVTSYTFTKAGESVTLPIENYLPGVTILEFTIEGTDITAQTVLTVAFEKGEEDDDEGKRDDLIEGDLNGDGKANINDAIELLKSIAGLPNNVVEGVNCDLNGDTRININDAIYLLKKIAGLV